MTMIPRPPCKHCGSVTVVKAGKGRNKSQRFECNSCERKFSISPRVETTGLRSHLYGIVDDEETIESLQFFVEMCNHAGVRPSVLLEQYEIKDYQSRGIKTSPRKRRLKPRVIDPAIDDETTARDQKQTVQKPMVQKPNKPAGTSPTATNQMNQIKVGVFVNAPISVQDTLIHQIIDNPRHFANQIKDGKQNDWNVMNVPGDFYFSYMGNNDGGNIEIRPVIEDEKNHYVLMNAVNNDWRYIFEAIKKKHPIYQMFIFSQSSDLSDNRKYDFAKRHEDTFDKLIETLSKRKKITVVSIERFARPYRVILIKANIKFGNKSYGVMICMNEDLYTKITIHQPF